MRANVEIARCRSSATPLMCCPRLGAVANDLRSPPAQKNRPDPVSTTTFVASVSQSAGGIGQLASHGVVHAVCGIGPVQGDAGDGAGLLERDGLVFGHPWTVSRGRRCSPGYGTLSMSDAPTTKVEMAASTPKTSRHTEVERKFDVVESTVSPSFEGLSSVARVERSPSQHLEAVYFDTPGHDLAAHRVTLRRRTGGSDAGWHLKLPAGPGHPHRGPGAARRRRRRRRSRTTCGTSCWPSCATGRWGRWRASRPTAPSTCSTTPRAPRSPSSATTR